MKKIEEYNELKGFELKGSVIVAWKAAGSDRREFIGLYLADAGETIEELLEENKLKENTIKHNILVPAFRLEGLNKEEKKALTLKNLKNEIWSWNKAYNFDEATEDLF